MGKKQCDQIWRNFAYFGKVLTVFEQFLNALISSTWQNFERTLAIFYAIVPIRSD